MAGPTREQVAAVRAVIYKPRRVRRVKADYNSIVVLMNIQNPSQPDAGPKWVDDFTGAPSVALKESVSRCRSIADVLRATAADLADVDIPADDRRDLRTTLVETANAWDARAAVWATPSRPNVDAATARISGPQLRALRAMTKVRKYLRDFDDVADLIGAGP